MRIPREYSPAVEVYLIDEAWLGMETLNRLWEMPAAPGREIRVRAMNDLAFPVCVGIGQFTTLSKLANFLAKKRPEYGGVCDLTSRSK